MTCSLDYLQLKESFLVYLKSEKNYSDNTVSSYRFDLDSFFGYASEHKLQVDQTDSIQNYIFHLKRSGYKSKTISRHLSSIRRFFHYLIKKRLLASNPCISLPLPKAEKRLPHIFTATETERLFSFKVDENDFIEVRDLAIFDLIYSCGLRVSECANIKLSDIELNSNKITITGKGDKQRIVFFGVKTRHNIETWLKLRNSYDNINKTSILFISKQKKPISVRTIQNRLKLFCKQRGIYKNAYPHMLRHSFATDMLQASKNLRAVQELLGHKNISTTQIYTHLDFDYLFDEYSQFHPRAKRKNS